MRALHSLFLLALVSCGPHADPAVAVLARLELPTPADCRTIPPGATILITAYDDLVENRSVAALDRLASLDARHRADCLEWAAALSTANPGSAPARALHADALARNGRLTESLRFYDEALQLGPAPAWVHLGHGEVLARASRLDDARRRLEFARELAPEMAEVHVSLGTLYLERRAPMGAEACFVAALDLSPHHPLALNGLGCVQSARSEWVAADELFSAAEEQLSWRLFSDNRRALALDFEAAVLGPPDGSPLLRFTDFTDWPALASASLAPCAAVRQLHGGPLPEVPGAAVLARLNAGLADAAFPGRLLECGPLAEDLSALARELQRQQHSAVDVRAGNRRLLELAHPGLLLSFERQQPGTQLTFSGFQDAAEYRQNRPTDKLVKAQARIDSLYRPTSQFLPGPLRRLYQGHLDNATNFNRKELSTRGVDLDQHRPGGVSTRVSLDASDDGQWVVRSSFGLQLAPGTQEPPR